jgi:hypothetical protein
VRRQLGQCTIADAGSNARTDAYADARSHACCDASSEASARPGTNSAAHSHSDEWTSLGVWELRHQQRVHLDGWQLLSLPEGAVRGEWRHLVRRRYGKRTDADASSHACANASTDAGSDASAKAHADACADASSDAGPDAHADACTDASSHACSDTSSDASSDASADCPAHPRSDGWTSLGVWELRHQERVPLDGWQVLPNAEGNVLRESGHHLVRQLKGWREASVECGAWLIVARDPAASSSCRSFDMCAPARDRAKFPL